MPRTRTNPSARTAKNLEPEHFEDLADEVVNDAAFDEAMDVVLDEHADELRELTT